MLLVFLVAQTWTTYLDSALLYIGMTRADLTFRYDYSIRDSYRFPAVDVLLNDPLRTSDFLIALDSMFWSCPDHELVKLGCALYPLKIRSNNMKFMDACSSAAQRVVSVFSAIPAELHGVFEELTTFSPDLTSSIEEEKALEKHQDSLVQYLEEHAALIDYASLFQASADLLSATTHSQSWLEHIPLEPLNAIPGVTGTVLYYASHAWGEVVVGDSNTNVYTGDFAVIIDLGGDDMYQCSDPDMISIIIDMAGNDVYNGGDYTVGCGAWGTAIVLDKLGNDTYTAGNYSLGCGVFGVGILIDEAGNDRYYGDTFTQGAGGFGIGILKDCAGNDLYNGALYAQGFASTYGISILGDQIGNDVYTIRAKYIDEIRYLDHYLSLSQGFAMGFRPDLSAGIGVILEKEGNDYYVGDIFAQASSYWYGIGGIVESSGNDVYVAYQYAQGAGTHITIGALIDKEGNDNYLSKGVSQGCGHDLSLGLLHDLAGDDSYVAFDLSQGAGNANGIGMLVDETGDDSYSAKRPHNTQGYGDFRREYGSVGVLLDIKGDDDYRDGEDRCVWTNGRYGAGVDFE
ncbi:hypothetical protein JXB22_02640 [candidate division WOR-3 bacterium]|nr:hypothetical protein [candidate division WOR-3 bacterium]